MVSFHNHYAKNILLPSSDKIITPVFHGKYITIAGGFLSEGACVIFCPWGTDDRFCATDYHVITLQIEHPLWNIIVQFYSKKNRSSCKGLSQCNPDSAIPVSRGIKHRKHKLDYLCYFCLFWRTLLLGQCFFVNSVQMLYTETEQTSKSSETETLKNLSCFQCAIMS